MRHARLGHGARGGKGPAVWVIQFGGSERSTDALAASDKYFSAGQQRRRVRIPTNTHAARGSKRPGSRIIELCARVMSTRYQHLAIIEQCGRMENTHHRHFPGGRKCACAGIVNLRGVQWTTLVVEVVSEKAGVPAGDKHFSTRQESGRVCRATSTHISSGPESRRHDAYICNRILACVLDTGGHHVERPPGRVWSRVLAAGRNGPTRHFLHAPGDLRV